METIFSKRMKEERKNRNLTQQQLADLINEEYIIPRKISRNSITRYENGTRTPDYNTLSAISIVLNVDADYLIGKIDKKFVKLTNDALIQFNKLISDIIEKDDHSNNDKLWSILYNVKGLIEQSMEHNLLDSFDNIIRYFSSTINLSINTNSPKLITDLEKNLLDNLRSYTNRNLKESTRKYIPHILKDAELHGISKLSTTDIEILKDFYFDSNTNDIPDIIKDIFSKGEK